MRSGLGLILCVFSLLAGCGGDDGGSTPPPTSSNPPPAPPPPPPVIGTAGGTVTETSGASVIVPAGALIADTTIRVAMDSTGAPPIPAGLTAAGNTYVVTPHGGDFVVPIEVSIPAPAVTLLSTQRLLLAKAQPGGEWTLMEDSVLDNGRLKANVSSFSFFTSVIVNYLLPIAQAAPYQVTVTLDCGGQDCANAVGFVDATYTVVSNNGQLPANCTDGWLNHSEYDSHSFFNAGAQPMGGYTISKRLPPNQHFYDFTGFLRCPQLYQMGGVPTSRRILWKIPPFYPNLNVIRAPAQLDVVEGLPAQLDMLMGGGAVKYQLNPGGPASSTPTATDRATIDWQRSDDGGASWRTIARSFQDEANSQPFGTGHRWSPWSVRHGFIATSTDQGALIRVHACYTPPAPAATPPCVTSSATLLNVLQQSAIPAITSAPRSVLVRTGETANLSASVSGLPAPTLQWQTRPANSNDAWSNVTTGTGATTANYTTAATALSDNGTQFRIVATNAVGSSASTAVTVSVSDLDVAPTIAAQPASLNVASGSDAVFAVDAHGTEALSYQWYRNGVALAGANSPVLHLTGVNMLNSGSFTVSVSNSAGTAASNAAILNVYPGTPAAIAPTIVTQPASLTVNVGNTATFAVGVDGSGPFTFQWRRNGINIAGATSAVLTLPSVVSDASGTFSVVVNNSVGPAVTSADASLSVSSSPSAQAPEITTDPFTIVVAPGGSAVLAVAANGSGPLFYQWAMDGVPLAGEEGPVLMLLNVGENDAGDYSVTVSNSQGSVVSQSATVILLGAPVIYSSPSSVHVFENSTTTFRVDTAGSNVHYLWLRNGQPISASDADSYTTPSLTVADSGAVYSVIVYNSAGLLVSAPAVLTVSVPVAPTILLQPADVSVVAGLPANICMAFGGTPPFSVQMNRWSGVEWTPIGSGLSVNDNAPFCTSTPNLQLADNGAQFIFFASNAEGGFLEAMTRTVTITVTASTGLTSTTLASRATSGATANNRSGAATLSADGNLVAFISDGTNLVPNFNGDAFTAQYAYVRNISTGVTTLINQTPAGTRSSTGVIGLKLAAGGRYAIFSSMAADLVADDTNGSQDVFVRDLQAGTTQRVSLRADGTELPFFGNGQSDMKLDISDDGRFVSFMSSQDLIGDDPSGSFSLYFRSLQSGFLRRVASTDAAGTVGHSALSANGEHLAYLYATFAAGNNRNIVVVYDTEANAYSEAFNIDSTNNASYVAQGMSISSNGRYVSFPVRSPSMFGGSTFTQVLAIDRNNPGQITVASGDSNGVGNGNSIFPKVSDDGHVLFVTNAGNLTGNFANAVQATLVVRDLQSTALAIASRRANGTPVLTITGYDYHDISRDGNVVAFVGNELDVSGGVNENQVYVTTRP
jgi:hypothetical protein